MRIRTFSFWFFSFFLLMLVISYVLTIFKGPGYLPINWNSTKKNEYSWFEQMDGVAVTEDQIKWIKKQEIPSRCSFSSNARRIIIRADHFCIWAQTWIGLYNNRYFILVVLYSTLFCFSFVFLMTYWIVLNYDLMLPMSTNSIIDVIIYLLIIYFVYIGYISIKHLIVSLKNLSNNITAVEKWNNRDNDFSRGSCMKNFSEVCGSESFMLLWPLPFITCFTPDTFRIEERHEDNHVLE